MNTGSRKYGLLLCALVLTLGLIAAATPVSARAQEASPVVETPTPAAPPSVSRESTFVAAEGEGPPGHDYPPDCGVLDDGFFTNTGTLMEVATYGFRGNDSGVGAITGFTQPTHGTLYMNSDLDGGFSYMPNPGFGATVMETDSFQYQITCTYSDFPTPPETKVQVGTVFLYVVPYDGPPPTPTVPTCAKGNIYTMYVINQSLTVDANAGYLSDDTGFYSDLGPTAPSHGTLSTGSGGGFTYTPDPGFTGTDQFFYSVMCGVPGINAHVETATVTIHVIDGFFDNTCAFDNSYSTNEGTALTVPANAGYLSDDIGYSYLRSTGSPMHGTLSGDVGLGGTGAFTYTPNQGFTGVDTFTYILSCNGGVKDETATVTITVNALNPCATIDTYSTDPGMRLDVPAPGVLGNDVDAAALSGFTMPANGYVFVAGDGSFFYVPNLEFTGVDTFTYTAACNGTPFRQSEATVFITVGDPILPMPTATTDPLVTPTMSPPTATVDPLVTPTMSAPTATATVPETCAVADDYYLTGIDMAFTIQEPGVFANDTIGNRVLQDVLPTTEGGMASVGSLGQLEYTPPPGGFTGTDTFQYVVNCGDAVIPNYVSATVFITVLEPGVTPTPRPTMTPSATATTDPDVTPTMTVTSTTEPTLTVTTEPTTTTTATSTTEPTSCVLADDAYAVPEDGHLVVAAPGVFGNDTLVGSNALQDVQQGQHGQVLVGSFGELDYTPDPGFVGTDSFTYMVRCDDEVAAQAVNFLTATVTITVGDETPGPTVDPSGPGATPITGKTPVAGGSSGSGGSGGAPVTQLPNTGAGTGGGDDRAKAGLLMGGMLVLLAGACAMLNARRARTKR